MRTSNEKASFSQVVTFSLLNIVKVLVIASGLMCQTPEFPLEKIGAKKILVKNYLCSLSFKTIDKQFI